jgi:hypothetical protein
MGGRAFGSGLAGLPIHRVIRLFELKPKFSWSAEFAVPLACNHVQSNLEIQCAER